MMLIIRSFTGMLNKQSFGKEVARYRAARKPSELQIAASSNQQRSFQVTAVSPPQPRSPPANR